MEDLSKKAPKGVDPEKHEKCVKDVKKQGKDVGSAHAICTSTMKKEEDDLLARIKNRMKQEMDKRNFTEVDATRHLIDKDRGEKIAAQQPKPKEPLLHCKISDTSLSKSEVDSLMNTLAKNHYRESALLIKNWGELDKMAIELAKSSYGEDKLYKSEEEDKEDKEKDKKKEDK